MHGQPEPGIRHTNNMQEPTTSIPTIEDLAKAKALSVANVFAKLRAGKSLSAEDKKTLEQAEKDQAPPGKQLSIRQIAVKTGATRETVKLALEKENLLIKHGLSGRYEEAVILKIAPHLPNYKGPIDTSNRAIMAPDGTSWTMYLAKQNAIAKERENEEAEEVKNKRWMLTQDCFAMLRAAMNRIEQFTGKVKSEAGLNDTQAAVIQKNIDDYRNQLAADIEGMKPK